MTVSIIAQPSKDRPAETADLVIVGGGAAGLATAIFARRMSRDRGPAATRPIRIVVLDGAKTLGAKILISGGSRCNVTNAQVEAADFFQAGSSLVKQVLRALPISKTRDFFEEIGVALKEEPLGKLFPVTNKSRTVLDALLAEALRLKIDLMTSCRVTGLSRALTGWRVETSSGLIETNRIVLATGGLSLPKTGSDGFGYTLARKQGHTIVPTVPALEPLILGGDFHVPLSGIAHEAAIRVARPALKPIEIRGSLLWTHFGISGPLALNASRFFRRTQAEGLNAAITLSFVPGIQADVLDRSLVVAARERPHHNLSTEVARTSGLAQALASRIVERAIGSDDALSRLTKARRHALLAALTAFPLDVIDGRGYNFAEVTSGGVALEEVNFKTMESRIAPGLYFAGEILDVDGRIGGFNFQWAWSTAMVAATAIARKW